MIDRAIGQKAVYESEVAEGQRRLEVLQAQAAPTVSELQEKIDTRAMLSDHVQTNQEPPSLQQVDGRGTSLSREHSTDADNQCARVGGMDQRSQLRSPQCVGVRRREFDDEDRTSGWARGQSACGTWQRRGHGRSVEVFHDVLVASPLAARVVFSSDH